MTPDQKSECKQRAPLPSVEKVRQELGKAEGSDDFFGKEGIFARLFADILEQMLEAELTAQLGYEKYEAKGRNSGNSRKGKTSRKLRTSSGDLEIEVPRDRKAFVTDLKAIDRAPTREAGESALLALGGNSPPLPCAPGRLTVTTWQPCLTTRLKSAA